MNHPSVLEQPSASVPDAVEVPHNNAASAPKPEAPKPTAQAIPVPMSFPAILRNPGVAKFVQRQVNERASASGAAPKKGRRDERGGKRWIRRDENGTCLRCPLRPRLS